MVELQRATPELGGDVGILAATVHARLFGSAPFRVGRFALERRIGAGGMGVVYLARDPDLQRDVAIKLVRPDLALGGDDARARMLREAQAMARLRHPNVVVVHEVGEHDGGIYLAMEYVPGSTLRGWLAAQQRSPREIIAAFVQAGRGLAAAHAVGLVHRDFKPDNVLISEDTLAAGEHARICVTDFGLATMPADIAPATVPDGGSDGPRSIATTMSSSGRPGVAGTLAYMAPECHGAQPATAASDQFSFCIALFEALWGRRPFGDTLEGIATAMIERTVPAVPRERGVPRRIRAVVLRGLSHDPRRRFPDMRTLLAELERELAGRRNGLLGLGLGLAVASIAAVAWSATRPSPCAGSDQAIRAAWSEPIAERIASRFDASQLPYAAATWTRGRAGIDAFAEGWARQASDACEATELRHSQSADLLDRRMTCLDRRRRDLLALLDVLGDADAAIVDRTTAAIDGLADPERCGDLEALARRDPLPVDPRGRALVEQAIDAVAASRAAHGAGRYPQAREQAERALELASDHRPTRAEALQALGNAQLDLGDGTAAELSFEQAIAAARAGGVDELSASAYNDLIFAQLSLDRLDDAERSVRFADAEIEALGDPPEQRASLLRMQAEIARHRGANDSAKQYAARSLELLEHALAPDDPDLAGARLALGNIRYAAGDYDGAIVAYQQAVDDFTEILGADHPRTLGARSNLANVFVQQRQLDEALTEHREILAARERVLGPDHHLLTANLIGIAGVYYFKRNIPEALVMQQRAVDLLLRTRGPEHVETLDARENLASMLIHAARAPEAAVIAQELIAIRRRVHGEDAPGLGETIEVYARALAMQDDLEGASVQVALAIAAIERSSGADHISLLDPLALAAELAHRRGEHERSIALAERAIAIGERGYGAGHAILGELIAGRDRCRRELD